MKRILIFILCLMPFSLLAQETQVIGGYLLDGKDSFEELEAAVLDGSKRKEKKLDDRGMRIPGGVVAMSPESIGKELGSVVHVSKPFLIRSISFTVVENRMGDCKASIRIYRMHDESDLENIVNMPIQQNIPVASGKAVFNVVPEEGIVLDPGDYYVSFSLSETDDRLMTMPADSSSKIYFPLYLKTSYSRKSADEPLVRLEANIGMSVLGQIVR